MSNQEHFAILTQGVDVWNEWRKQNPEIEPDLNEADLKFMNLSHVNFSSVYAIQANLLATTLVEADLTECAFLGAILDSVDLTGANLREANLSGCSLRRARLSNANLRGADLGGTNLTGADLRGAVLRGAQVGWTAFGNIDLSVVHELDSVIHEGPSSIGIDTIYLSNGHIPEVFLRGCGAPDTFIAYMQSLVAQPIQFFSAFISFSAKDKSFCDRLYADLRARGIRIWYFPEDAKWGESLWGEIDRSIKVYDKLIVVCSKHSLKSGPVLHEIDRALNREDREGKNVLFPIRIDDYIFDSWQHERKEDVLRKVVGDFKGWNRSATKYQAAFAKLLRALQAD